VSYTCPDCGVLVLNEGHDCGATVLLSSAMSHAPEPWERQPKDTATSWARFVAFRGMPAPRDRISLARAFDVTPNALNTMATKHDFVARARAWDAEQQRRQDEASLEMAAEIKRKQLDGLDTIASRAIELVEEGDGSAADGARMFDIVIKNRRLIQGAATARTETVALSEAALDGGLNLDALTDGERVEWRRLVDKMATAEEG